MTTPIYLVRHAKAGSRTRWADRDHLRPLTKRGRRQAKALVELFATQPFARILSSSHVRCVETLEPLAWAHGIPVEVADELAEGAATADALQLMLSVAADGPAALCTHGDVLQRSVRALASTGAPLDGGSPLDLAKGSTWILEVTGGAFTRGRYVPPPEV
jgi:8-oxo-dGTP diphosphatase